MGAAWRSYWNTEIGPGAIRVCSDPGRIVSLATCIGTFKLPTFAVRSGAPKLQFIFNFF